MRNLAVLGSTGSIGTSTLEVVLAHPERLSVLALAAGRNRDLLRVQCEAFRPRCVSVGSKEDADWIRSNLSYEPELHWGEEGLLACALYADADTVVAAIVGSAGLASTEAALRAGRRVCVANKESLVVGGALMHEAALAGGGELLPVDSEHAALHQLLADRDPGIIREVRITASGGPFKDWPLARIQAATVAEALNHPTWKMGPKITIDSATLMNKGLEVIEASILFGLAPDQVAVTVHPQSQVHAMVGFHDGSYQLQVCANDMKLPIQVPPALSGQATGSRGPLSLGRRPAMDLRGSRSGAFPLPGPGLSGPEGGGHGPGPAECRQRGGRGRFPPRPPRILGHPGLQSGGPVQGPSLPPGDPRPSAGCG